MSDSVIVDGRYGRFEGSADDRVIVDEYRRLGTWAPELVALISQLLFAGRAGTFIDVGANIGLVCIPVIERCGGIGIAFEPEPKNHAYLSRNVRAHGLERRIECHALACHSTSGRMALSLSPDNLGDHRLQRTAAAPDEPLRRQISVETRRLDDVLRGRDLPRPIVMKVDAQGSEASVFAGARETLARVDHLVTEYSPALIVAHGDDAQAFRAGVLEFPYAAVLHVLPLPEPLHSSSYVFQQLSWIADDGSDPGFFDLLFSRTRVLPPPP
jgi:FkbM family methyltransferase